MKPRASVLIPTRDRPGYLEAALASIAPQAAAVGAEIVVVEDGPADPRVRRAAREHAARLITHGETRGPNAARNTAIAAATGDLLVLVDDDIDAWPGWLAALVAAADALPEHEAFGGPIRPRLEGIDVHACGRESLPVTTLDHGPEDRDVRFAWSANLAIRRSALRRVGPFDPGIEIYGDEEDWLRRLEAAGGRVRYVAAAGVDHRRAGADATWRGLARAAWHKGRNSRRYDMRKGSAPPAATEAALVLRCVWHIVRRRCGNGILLTAMSAGRLREAVAPRPFAPRGPDWASGQSGTLSRRTALTGRVRDAVEDARALPGRLRLTVAARRAPRRRVLALCVARPARAATARAARAELQRSRHDVEVVLWPPAPGAGRWQNLTAALRAHPLDAVDWLLIVDDDVVLPRGFLDRFLLVAERLDLRMAQPAHAHASHAAWPVTRRHAGAVARETRFVEQGPVLALRRDAAQALAPFPDLQMGWGIDSHWSAAAAERGWRIGVVDATPVRHLQPVAGDYPRDAAIAEAEAFLAGRPYVRRDEAAVTVRAHRRVR